MSGPVMACQGRLCQPAELKTSAKGRRYLGFSIMLDKPERGDEDTPPEFVSIKIFERDDRDLEALAAKLKKGAIAYAEGFVSIGRWTSKTGEAKSGLNVMAWRVEVLYQVGRDHALHREEQGSRARSRPDPQRQRPAAPSRQEADDGEPF